MVRGDVGKDPQHHPDNSRRTRGQAIDAVGEVHTIGEEHDDDDRHHDEDGHPDDLLHPWIRNGEDLRVIEVIGLEEGDRGLEALGIGGLEANLTHTALADDLAIALDDDRGAEVERHPDNEAEDDLPDDLVVLLQAVLILLEYLDIVISKAQKPHQERRDDHQDDVDIVQSRKEERRHQDRHDDDDTTHRGGALLRLLAFETEVTHQLADLLATEEVNDLAPPDRADQERHDER